MTEADVHARLWIRVEEIRQSLKIVRQILAHLPMGPVQAPLRARAGEGMALIEAFRGECLTYVRLDVTGHVERAHQRDASWFHWPLLESPCSATSSPTFRYAISPSMAHIRVMICKRRPCSS